MDINNAQDLVNIVLRHNDFLGQFASIIDTKMTIYQLDDKPMTIQEWKKYFTVKLPSHAEPDELRKIQADLDERYNLASFYYAHSQLIADMFEEASSEKFDMAIKMLVDDHKAKHPESQRLPSAATLQTLSRANNPDLSGSKAAVLARLNFWKIIVKKLERNIKNLEAIAMSLGLEAKLLNNR